MYVRNKPKLYEAMGRSGWELPSIHASVCTIHFLFEVRKGVFYCPKTAEIGALQKCFSPPTKEILLEKLQNAIRPLIHAENVNASKAKPMERLLNELTKRSADTKWLVLLMAIWAPNDEIFKKDYVWIKPKAIPIEYQYENDDHLFDDLPRLSDKDIRRHNRLRIPKEDRIRLKLKKLALRRAELDEYEARLTLEVEEFNNYGEEDGNEQEPQ